MPELKRPLWRKYEQQCAQKQKGITFRNEWKLVSWLKFDHFFRISPKKCTKMKKRTFFWEGYWERSCALTFRPLGLNCWLEGCQGVKIMFPKDEDQQCIALLKKFTFQIMMLWLKDDWINKCNAAGAAAASSIFPLKKQKLINSRAELEHWTPSFR